MLPLIWGVFRDFWYGTTAKVVSWFLKPIFDALVNLNILDENYMQVANDFVDDLLLKFKFARDVIINVTGLPVQVFIILGAILEFTFAGYISCLALKFIGNTYLLIRGSKSVGRTIK